MKTSKKKYPECAPDGTAWLFPATNPPIETDVGSWQWRTASPIYRRKIKRAVQLVTSYRFMKGELGRLSRQDRDACHRLLDTLTFDANRGGPRRERAKENLMGDGQGEITPSQ